MPDFEKKALDFTEAFAVDIIVAARIKVPMESVAASVPDVECGAHRMCWDSIL
jgi:hypothetical protein